MRWGMQDILTQDISNKMFTLNLRAGGADGLEASSVRSWFSNSRILQATETMSKVEITNNLTRPSFKNLHIRRHSDVLQIPRRHWQNFTWYVSAAAAPECVSPRRTSSAGPASPPWRGAPAGRSAPGPSPSWCRRWWRSPASGTRWTPCPRSPRTPGCVNRRASTACSAPALGPWWSARDGGQEELKRRTVKSFDFVTRGVHRPHLVPVKGAVVVHDVHRAAVEQISQPPYFIRSYWLHRICGGEPGHSFQKNSTNNITDSLLCWCPTGTSPLVI